MFTGLPAVPKSSLATLLTLRRSNFEVIFGLVNLAIGEFYLAFHITTDRLMSKEWFKYERISL